MGEESQHGVILWVLITSSGNGEEIVEKFVVWLQIAIGVGCNCDKNT